ncbi:MAG: NAD(P)/FAD-dependent oxidoreductase [Rubrobacteraceae bacterium]
MMNGTNGKRTNIVVLGGGFGGLESAFYLRWKLEEKADITLISDRDYFLYKPNTIYIPFGLDPDKLKIDLARPTRRKNIKFVKDRVREIDPEAKTVGLENANISYDYLVVATGADMKPEEVPGLGENAYTIWTPQEMLQLRLGFYKLLEEAHEGAHKRVLFLVPPNNKCSGPLYEMVFMLDTWLRRKEVRNNVDITWTTYEDTYIQAFGPRLHGAVIEEFARRSVNGHNHYIVEKVEDGVVHYQNGGSLPYDYLITFSPYIAHMNYPALPGDERGFIEAELGSRQVIGQPDIYVVGDAGNFPVKQAFLSFLQADAAAEHLSGRILGTTPEMAFEPTSMCVMEQFDKGTFAQVPLRLTGVPEKPVEVEPAAMDAYKLGSSPVWRLGKKALSYYLPFRFANGNPFHAGVPWKGMEVGLKAMSRVMAK